MGWFSKGTQTEDSVESYVQWESERMNALQKMSEDLEALKEHLDDPAVRAQKVQALVQDIERFRKIPLPPTSPVVESMFANGKLEVHHAELGTLAEAQHMALALLQVVIELVNKKETPVVGGGPLNDIREAQRMLRRLMVDEATFINHAQ
jgi:hypothetical protein